MGAQPLSAIGHLLCETHGPRRGQASEAPRYITYAYAYIYTYSYTYTHTYTYTVTYTYTFIHIILYVEIYIYIYYRWMTWDIFPSCLAENLQDPFFLAK